MDAPGTKKRKVVKFKCESWHIWFDPFPTEDAPIMTQLFGICPLCNGQGTAINNQGEPNG